MYLSDRRIQSLCFNELQIRQHQSMCFAMRLTLVPAVIARFHVSPACGFRSSAVPWRLRKDQNHALALLMSRSLSLPWAYQESEGKCSRVVQKPAPQLVLENPGECSPTP